jgi:hypothetical protein
MNYDSSYDSLGVSFSGTPPAGYYVTVTFNAKTFSGPDTTTPQPVIPETIELAPLVATVTTLDLNEVGATAQIAASEAGGTLTAKSANTAVVTVPASPTSGTFTVTAQGAGTTTVTISDGTVTQKFKFVVTTTGGVIH